MLKVQPVTPKWRKSRGILKTIGFCERMMIFFIFIPPLNFTVITVYHISELLSIYGINFSLLFMFLLILHNECRLTSEKCFFSSTI